MERRVGVAAKAPRSCQPGPGIEQSRSHIHKVGGREAVGDRKIKREKERERELKAEKSGDGPEQGKQ